MSSALKPVLTPTGSQNPPIPAQMNKPMHPQGGPGPYGQQMPQNLMNIPHGNPSPAHNLSHSQNSHQNHYSLNIPSSYQGTPQPVASNHPVANQAHAQPISYSPPKPPPQVYAQSYQMHSNIPASQSLPATQAHTGSEPEKPQSNGTTEAKAPPKVEQNHVTTPKKETLQSPEKAKISPALSASTSAESKPVVLPAEVKQAIEPAEVPQTVDVSTPAVASATTSSSPSAPTSAATTTTATKDPPAAPIASTSPPTITSSLPPASSSSPQKIEPPVAPTVESSTPASANSPTSSAASSATPSPAAKPAEIPDAADPAPATTPTAEKPDEPQEAQSTTAEVPVSPAKPKEQSTPTKSPIKVATTPRTPSRKSKSAKPEESPKSSRASTSSVEPKPSSSKSPAGGKVKRMRIRTQPYQSPLPEIEIITKMTSTSTPRSKNNDEKLIIFYKNEFLAVRNSEGGFYICQAVQNVYKSSPKIRIRWLSQEKAEKTGEIYTPDFYDYTDFDCILTNLNLERVDKGKYKLPAKEKTRTDNILKRAIAVEKGEATSLDDSLTEDNPDGLDVSLYKDEEQLKKRKGTKRKAPARSSARSPSSSKSPESPKVARVASKRAPPAKTPKKTPARKAATPAPEPKPTPTLGRAERAKRRGGADDTPVTIKSSPVVDKKKATVIAKVAKRTAVVVASPKTPTSSKTPTKLSKQPVASTSKAKPKPAAKPTPPPPARSSKRSKK